jgi:vanillate/4-hydroxybenzoate decarboxylase subunit D
MTEALSNCPRCRSATTEVRSRSPVAGVWTVFGCGTCLYTWRSTEPRENRDPEAYPSVFRIDPSVLPKLEIAPTIPALIPPSGGPAQKKASPHGR